MKNLSHVPALAQALWRLGPWLCTASVLLRATSAAFPLAVLWVAKILIDKVVHGYRTGRVDHTIWLLVAAECGMVMATDLSSRIIGHLDTVLSDRFLQWVGIRILEHSELLDLESFENPSFQDCLERARSQARSNFAILFSIAQFLQQGISVISLLAGVLLVSPMLVVFQAACTIPTMIGELHYAKRAYRLYRQRSPQRREMDYLLQLATSATSVKETKLFGFGAYLTDRYRRISDLFNEQNADLSKTRTIVSSVLTGIGTLAFYAAYSVLIRRVIAGRITIGELIFLAGAFQRSKGQMQGVLSQLSRVADHAMYLEDIFEFFRARPRLTSAPASLLAPRPIRTGLEFRNVSFRYVNSTRNALTNVSFTLGQGERVALVGANGAGKTTVIKLMARLYDPTEGNIFLDGIDLREYELEGWRREISILFQDFVRYDMEVGENIGLGDIHQLENLERIQKAAEDALAGRLVSRLPGSFRQMLGRRFDGGIDLSGGQWQKLAMARACMRDAQLLILDEPTAALDPRTEHRVFQQFSRLTEGRMALLISHRFSTVRAADRIVVFDAGKVVEQGTHRELLTQGGEYASLFHLQAAAYGLR